MTRSERSFLAQFRLGILPINIETGRFTAPPTPVENRICTVCDQNSVENEIHFLIECTLYNTERQALFQNLLKSENLLMLDKQTMFINIVNTSPRALAKYVQKCYFIRNSILFQN